ncbi:MAG: hypothetical protein HY094_09975 [Candidatus Melainabacteria bacterium]|nr:hypothetical protein [Candidatus Melainabacteria bacterium]
MHIPYEQLQQFKNIYKQEFGIELTDEEAYEKEMRLMMGMKAIYSPIIKEKYTRLEREEKELEIEK